MERCWMCKGTFGPKEVNSVGVLQTFKGYTVDFRLKQFRYMPLDAESEFIDFDTPKGAILCDQMHEAAVEQLNKKVEAA